MKKILLGLVAMLVVLGMATANVKAASVNADKTEVKKGETVVVTVNMEEETRNVDVKLAYDANLFEYVKGSASSTLGTLTVNDATAGKVIVSGSNPSQSTKQVSFSFVAKQNTDKATFTASGLVTEKEEELTSDSVSVKVVEEAKPTQPENPTQPDNQQQPQQEQQQAQQTQQAQSNTKVDSNGNKITRLPQTGIPYAAFAIAGVAVISAVLVIKRKIK